MGWFDDFVNTAVGGAVGGVTGAAVGYAFGDDIRDEAKNLNSKPPAPIAAPAAPTLGVDTQSAEEKAQGKRRGQAADELTSGGGRGLSYLGPTARSVLLGS